ncbi:MAG: sulfatase [Lewinella sp.]
MHTLAKLSLLSLCLLTFSCTQQIEQSYSPAEKLPPNVLFIAVDDLRPELGAYGRSIVHSPNIDRLAARAMRFTNAYCNVPVCGASRASLMTGIRPTRNRFVDYSTRIEEDAPGVTTLHGHFKENGYYSVALGKVLHHTDDREDDYNEPNWRPTVGAGKGRDYHSPKAMAMVAEGSGGRGPAFERGVLADSAYWDGKIAARAVDYVDKLAAGDQPFFLAVGFMKPHLPFNAPERYWQRYDSVDFELPPTYFRGDGTPEELLHNSGELRNYLEVPEDRILPEDYARTLIHGYYASVSFVDAQIGKVLDALEATGEADNTIVILWGDHGWNLGDHTMWCKHTVFNSSLRVPLLIDAPGLVAGTAAAMVEYVDLFPTLAELAGLPRPDQLDGRSLVPLLQDPDREWDNAVFTRWYDGDNITTDRYAYTEWRDTTGELYARALFDHHTDSLETNSVARDHRYQAIVDSLSRVLLQHKRGK